MNATSRIASLRLTTALPALLFGSLAMASTAHAQGLPSGGSVSAGSATIVTGPGSVTINQSSGAAAINWDSFSIGQGNSVTFVQPNSSAVALNRVTGADPSVILGNLSANGKLFLVNPNGVLFGRTAQVNVGGLVASTLDVSDADFMAGRHAFAGSSKASVLNQGSITATDGGFVALLGANVSNQGVIVAQLGTVALAGGQAVTLDFAGDGLLNVKVDTGAVNALVENGGLIRADGGQVVLTAQSAGQLLHTVVNNDGVIEARTLGERGGTIVLLADMQTGTANISGRLDASAADGGDGGFIETSGATVNIANGVRITTAAAAGETGTWLIDPADFTIAPLGGNISGATLSDQLVTNSVTISTLAPDNTGGNGDIFVNDAIAWTASGTPTTLTLNGFRDVDINAPITAVEGNLVVCCGRDVNVNAAITTTRGSVLLNAGQDVHVFHAITTVDGNIALCAGHDVHIDAAVTLTRGTTIPARSLGLPIGLTLIAGGSGVGPGPAGGTIIFAPLTPPTTVTVAPVSIAYNPVSYSAPTDFSTNFVLTEGAALTQRMLLFANGDKLFDGTTTTTLNGFQTTALSGLPGDVSLVAGPGSSAFFDSPGEGAGIGITYAGYTLGGADADRYALAGSCCVPTFRTTGTITPAAIPPVVTPPVTPPVVPPVDTPPVVPPVTPPPDVPPVVPPAVIPPVVVPPVAVPPEGAPSGSPAGGPDTPLVPGLAAATIPTGATLLRQTPLVAPFVDSAPQVLNFAVVDEGVRMPANQLELPGPVTQQPAPVVAPAVPTPAPRPARVYAPKQDRN